MKPGTSDTDAHLMSPCASRRACSLSAASPLRRARSQAAGRYRPVNIGPFSIGLHQPMALGFPSVQSSGEGSSPTKSRMMPCGSTNLRHSSSCACLTASASGGGDSSAATSTGASSSAVNAARSEAACGKIFNRLRAVVRVVKEVGVCFIGINFIAACAAILLCGARVGFNHSHVGSLSRTPQNLPPSTMNCCAVHAAPSSAARKRTICANSSGMMRRLMA